MSRFSTQSDQRQDTESDPNNPVNAARDIREKEEQAASNPSSHPESSRSSRQDVSDAGRQVEERESTPKPSWTDKTTPQPGSKKSGKGKFMSRKGPLMLVAGGLIAMMFGVSTFSPFLLSSHLLQNMTGVGDSSSTAFGRRFRKVFHRMNNSPDPVCASKKIKCSGSGRISNSALRKLDKSGVRACFDRKCDQPHTKRTGYPKKGPMGYSFTAENGQSKFVNVKDLDGFLKNTDNARFTAKIYGPTSRFNPRVLTKAGKHAKTKLFNRLGLKRDGGLADGKTSLKGSAKEKLKAINDKMKSKIPQLEQLQERAAGVKEKLNKKLQKSKKGGVAYLTAVAACLIPKLPRIVASGVAAVQIAQITQAAMAGVLSPGAKAQVSGAEKEYEMTVDDGVAVNTALTNTVPRESDGKLTAAVDSDYLLFAAGLNTARPPVHKEFTPGYSFLISKAVKVGEGASKMMKGGCDIVLNPVTMYSFMSANLAATVVASSTIIGGIIKLAAEMAIQKALTHILAGIAGDIAKDYVIKLAQNDKIPQAKGEALGDVLGIGAIAFFGADGMSRHLPTLTESELPAYEAVRQEEETMWRKMAVASLSPFDISTPYTFMGSIAFNFNLAMSQNHSVVSKLLAMMPNPVNLASAQVGAATGYTQNYCSYGKDFEIEDGFGGDGEGAEDKATRNIAGLPCTGILPSQVSMSADEAVDLMIDEGWIDNSGEIEVPDNATIGDLVQVGIIKKDNPLYDFINECSDAASGDYLFMSESCNVLKLGEGDNNPDTNMGECTVYDGEEEGGESTEVCPDESTIKGIKNPRSALAISTFLIDFQLAQSINGEDEETVDAASE